MRRAVTSDYLHPNQDTLELGKATLPSRLGRIAAMLSVACLIVGVSLLALLSLSTDLISGANSVVPSNPSTSRQFGIAADFPALSDADLTERLQEVRETGSGWIRFDLDWSKIQPNDAGNYDWSSYDRVAGAAQANNLKVLMIIDFTPAWARSSDCTSTKLCPPASPQTFATFAAAAATHYQAYGVHTWEIWNEPNISFRWHPGANPAQYVELLKASYTSIKRTDSNAFIIGANTAPTATDGANYNSSDFLAAMYDAGAAGYFDAISTHPYTYPITPSQSSPDDAWGQMQSMRVLMEDHGDGKKKIWITEFGAPTNGPNIAENHVSESLQATIAKESITEYEKQSWAGPFFWYELKDSGTSTTTKENFFGLIRYDGSKKPAYYVFKQLVSDYR